MKRLLLVLLLLAAPAWAEAGFPEARQVPGATLRLNGTGVRLYSVFQVKVYAAALYLEQPGHDAAAILASPQRKAIDIHAFRAVAADDVREAWRQSLAANCAAPCRLPPEAEAFVAAVTAAHEGGTESYLFDTAGVRVLVDGRPTGTYGPAFAHLLLSTFIGPSPPTQALKRALLGETP